MKYDKLWDEFIGKNPEYAECDYSAYDYDNETLDLILNGEKTTEVSLYQSYINVGEPLPIKGDLAIISDEADEARCIIKIKNVELKPFSAIKNKTDVLNLKEMAEEEKIDLNEETIVVVESFEII